MDYHAFLGRFRVTVVGGPAGGQRWAEEMGPWGNLYGVVGGVVGFLHGARGGGGWGEGVVVRGGGGAFCQGMLGL